MVQNYIAVLYPKLVSFKRWDALRLMQRPQLKPQFCDVR
jgi:hypothetical protein